MHNPRARLIILLLRAPQVLERAQRRQNRASDPHAVLALGRRDNLHLHTRGREGGEFLLHAVGDAGEHGGAAGEDDVAVEVASDVEVAFEDRIVAGKGKGMGEREVGGLGRESTYVVS